MSTARPLGDYINGRFLEPTGKPLVSRNPARDNEPVLETRWDRRRVATACEAAAVAQPAWAQLSRTERWHTLLVLREVLQSKADELADAIVLETGKIRSEAIGEVQTVISRFQVCYDQIERDMRNGRLPSFPSEGVHYHALGVVGVIGPFNFPVHLCHSHIIPALLLGNTVVVKPSEVTPLSMQRYFQAVADAGLPAGVLNLVQGGGHAGEALVANKLVRGLCFTGSYATGYKIASAAVERPELLVALEMGGKNAAVVLDDADIRQTVHELVVGTYLSAGQRCTATSRVLVHRARRDALLNALEEVVPQLKFGNPDDAESFAGPMATEAAVKRFYAALQTARRAGAKEVVKSERGVGGNYVTGSVHLLPDGAHRIPGYTDVELFGPDLCVETVDSLDEAVEVLRASPFGFANTVFTSSRQSFDALLRRTHSGILNWNCTTNSASPRLAFGGVAQSGNYRPAGAHAPRNLGYPVAIIEQLPGELSPHPALADLLPAPDLDVLEARHLAEEATEGELAWAITRRPMAPSFPEGGSLPTSEGWLRRLYAAERMVREKKPLVFDHQRASGAWMVSIDSTPLSVLDGMSQTATSPAGFNADEVVSAYFEGGFNGAMCRASHPSPDGGPQADAFRNALRARLGGLLPEVTFTSSGAEANEKALALCRLDAREGATKVLAFEGSFHGRTLLALHATWNPAKRERFEFIGNEATFAPFPVWERPSAAEPVDPEGFAACLARGDVSAQLAVCPKKNTLLRAELESLLVVHEALSSGDFYAVMAEPMQSEGGDRYATSRFFRGLRLLTRFHEVALVMDEVQTGFGLGGTFFWHTRFGMIDKDGRPDAPDAVTMAKRAQLGIVASRFPDPEPTPCHMASLVRGRIHARIAGSSSHASRVAEAVAPRLRRIAQRFPDLVGNPRLTGFAFAFDLPSKEALSAYLAQRFWRGVVVFGAGQRTVRYRLNRAFHTREITTLFEAIERSLAWLIAHPGLTPPVWEEAPAVPKSEPSFSHRVRQVWSDEANTIIPRIMDLERRLYEAARRDPEEKLRLAFAKDGVAHVAEIERDDEWELVGCALGAPLEHVGNVPGPATDPNLGQDNTLYSLAISVDPEYQGHGIGSALKFDQIRAARAMATSEGHPRYRFLTGRNRVGDANQMTYLNRRFGAYAVELLDEQYGEEDAQALYYRIPLTGLAPVRSPLTTFHASSTSELGAGIAAPFGDGPVSLREAQARGLLYGPTVNKITVLNYVTPAIVRSAEWIGALTPDLRHLYFTNSRAEIVDKAVRILRWHRPSGQTIIGLDGGYFGHTTAAARSISDPETHRQGPAVFDWPRVPHPADVGTEATIQTLLRAIEQAGGSDNVLGVVLEFVQEHTGKVIPKDFWPALDALRDETGVPFVLFETASAVYRSGRGAFASTALDVVPDMLCWFGGGQVGFIHTDDRTFVSKPLAMASTWDGDELSLIRINHHLRAARRLDLATAAEALDEALAPAAEAGFAVRGMGLYRVLECKDPVGFHKKLASAGINLGFLPSGRLVVAPHLHRAEQAAAKLRKAIGSVL